MGDLSHLIGTSTMGPESIVPIRQALLRSPLSGHMTGSIIHQVTSLQHILPPVRVKLRQCLQKAGQPMLIKTLRALPSDLAVNLQGSAIFRRTPKTELSTLHPHRVKYQCLKTFPNNLRFQTSILRSCPDGMGPDRTLTQSIRYRINKVSIRVIEMGDHPLPSTMVQIRNNLDLSMILVRERIDQDLIHKGMATQALQRPLNLYILTDRCIPPMETTEPRVHISDIPIQLHVIPQTRIAGSPVWVRINRFTSPTVHIAMPKLNNSKDETPKNYNSQEPIWELALMAKEVVVFRHYLRLYRVPKDRSVDQVVNQGSRASLVECSPALVVALGVPCQLRDPPRMLYL